MDATRRNECDRGAVAEADGCMPGSGGRHIREGWAKAHAINRKRNCSSTAIKSAHHVGAVGDATRICGALAGTPKDGPVADEHEKRTRCLEERDCGGERPTIDKTHHDISMWAPIVDLKDSAVRWRRRDHCRLPLARNDVAGGRGVMVGKGDKGAKNMGSTGIPHRGGLLEVRRRSWMK
jgi:hypothetical protein